MVKPTQNDLYAVGTGTYCGEMLAYVEEDDENYSFITVPKLEIRQVPIDKFDIGLDYKIMEFVEKLPDDVYELLKAEYFYKKEHK